jgi:hypothetical protein
MSTPLTRRPAALAFFALAGIALASAGALAAEVAPAPARATMQQVFTAETLYTCPMHPAVVSADSKLDCPLCEMHLAPVGAEARKALLAQKLAGCPMDPIVVKAEGAANCPICGMKLTALVAPTLKAQAAAPAGDCCKPGAAASGCCQPAAGSEPSANGSHKH